MKRLTIATVILASMALLACDDSPTAPTPANITGAYDLTVTASSVCSANLPADTRVIKYIANITQTGVAFNVSLLAHVIFNSAAIIGTVSGQTITFTTFAFNESTTGGGIALSSTGTANVATDGSITGTLNGTYLTPTGASCSAANHHVQMVKK